MYSEKIFQFFFSFLYIKKDKIEQIKKQIPEKQYINLPAYMAIIKCIKEHKKYKILSKSFILSP